MSAEPSSADYVRRKLNCAVCQIRRNVSAFSPAELEEMVRVKLIDATTVPPDLRTSFVRHKLGLKK